MIKKIFVVLFLMILTGMLAAQPKIEFPDGEVHEFGIVEPKINVKHEFKFINTGTDTLHIREVKSSCGCMGAVTSNNDIPPGASGTIGIDLETRTSPKLSKTVTVYSNDPKRPSAKLRVNATVDIRFKINPAYIKILSTDIRDVYEISLQNFQDKPLKLLEVNTARADFFECLNPVLTVSPKETATIKFRLVRDKLKTGQVTGNIALVTDCRSEPIVNISVYGFIPATGPLNE